MQPFQLTGRRSSQRKIVFAPDGRTLAVGSGQVALIDTVEARVQMIPELNYAFCDLAFARGGDALAVVRFGEIYVLDRLSGRLKLFRSVGNQVYALAATPTADRLFVSAGGPAFVPDLRDTVLGPVERAPFIGASTAAAWLTLSADGRWLACYYSGGLCVWDVSGPAPPEHPTLTQLLLSTAFALSGDGARLVAVRGQGVCAWDVKTDAEVFRSGKHRRSVTAVACHPSRELIVTGDSGGKVFVWDHTGRVLTKFDWGLKHVAGLTFSPDGLQCAAVDAVGKVVVWDVDT